MARSHESPPYRSAHQNLRVLRQAFSVAQEVEGGVGGGALVLGTLPTHRAAPCPSTSLLTGDHEGKEAAPPKREENGNPGEGGRWQWRIKEWLKCCVLMIVGAGAGGDGDQACRSGWDALMPDEEQRVPAIKSIPK